MQSKKTTMQRKPTTETPKRPISFFRVLNSAFSGYSVPMKYKTTLMVAQVTDFIQLIITIITNVQALRKKERTAEEEWKTRNRNERRPPLLAFCFSTTTSHQPCTYITLLSPPLFYFLTCLPHSLLKYKDKVPAALKQLGINYPASGNSEMPISSQGAAGLEKNAAPVGGKITCQLTCRAEP